jgi:hypothetical protein
MASSTDSSDEGCCSKGKKALIVGVLGLGVCGAFFFWLFLCARDAGAQTNSISAERERRLQMEKEIKEEEKLAKLAFLAQRNRILKGLVDEPPRRIEDKKVPSSGDPRPADPGPAPRSKTITNGPGPAPHRQNGPPAPHRQNGPTLEDVLRTKVAQSFPPAPHRQNGPTLEDVLRTKVTQSFSDKADDTQLDESDRPKPQRLKKLKTRFIQQTSDFE